MSPKVNESLNQEAMRNLIGAWPAFAQAQIEQSWAGVIDVTPDSNPVISPISAIPGLTLATGFPVTASAHRRLQVILLQT